MSNTPKYIVDLNNIKAKVTELDRLLNAGEIGFKLNEVLSSYASMFDRFCPYKVGDRVQLKESLDIPKGHGWYHCRHFLIKGAIATVKECGYRDGLFSFGLIFDDESDIHYQTGEIIPTGESERHLFTLPEDRIEKLDLRHDRDINDE
jgi:hypothetical protein